MSLRDIFIFEGKADVIFRNEAAKTMAMLVREMKLQPENFRVTPRSVNAKGGTATSIPLNLLLEFSFAPGSGDAKAEFKPTKSGAKALIKLWVEADVNEPGFDPLDWITSHPGEWRDAFIHEYIHYLDWTRIGAGDWRIASHALAAKQSEYSPTGQLRKYYQEPLEQNAIFQQVADAIAQEVTPDAARSMGIDSFYRLFVRRMQQFTEGAPTMYRERQIPHLKKRVAQLYSDITQVS